MAVTLVVERPDAKVKKCIGFIEKQVKGEPLSPAAKSPCAHCSAPCNEEEKILDYLKKA